MFLVSSKVLNKKFHNVEFEEHILSVNRVVKVTKGGRVFSFSSLVAIGNKNGYFGVGLGKGLEVNEARRKAINNAKKNLFHIILTKSGTIPHEVSGKFCASKILIRPGKPGSGIIAGGCTRVILECLGVKSVVAKCIGSTNPYNVTMCTVEALMQLKSAKYYQNMRKNVSSFDITSSDEEVVESKDEDNENNNIAES